VFLPSRLLALPPSRAALVSALSGGKRRSGRPASVSRGQLFPWFAQRETVFGFTRNIRATFGPGFGGV